MATQTSLVVSAGADEDFDVSFYSDIDTNTPQNLTGYTVTLLNDQLQALGQVIVNDPAAGKCVLSFSAVQSAALKPRQRVRFRLTKLSFSKMQPWFILDRD